LATAGGAVSFEVVDQAFVEGAGAEAKVVTASPPFPGFISGIGALAANPATAAFAVGAEQSYFFLMWSFERLLVGIASQGVIVGKVVRTIPPGPGEINPTFAGIAGAKVYLTDGLTGAQPDKIAISQADGRFSLWDPRLGGGTRKVTAEVGEETIEASAFELDAAQPDSEFFPGVDLFRYYRNVGKVRITFPPETPPPAAPQLDVRIFRRDASGNRVDAGGLVASGTPLVIGVKVNLANADLRSLSISGQYGTKYLLSIGAGIADLDSPPKPLVAAPVDFKTEGAKPLAATDEVWAAPRVVVLGDYAYITHPLSSLTNELRAYDVHDPNTITGPVATVGLGIGMPMDVGGEEASITNGNRTVVAVATGIPGGGIDSEVGNTIPSRLRFFDASNPSQLTPLGSVNLTASANQEGTPLRMVMFHGAAYVATFLKGIQIVRLDDVAGNPNAPTESVVQTIPVTQPGAGGVTFNVTMYDLEAGDFVINGTSRTLVAATGRAGLVVVDPAGFPPVLFQGDVTGPGGGLVHFGTSLALGTVNDKRVALVIGQGVGLDGESGAAVAGPVLAVIDLTDPRAPHALGVLALPETATDVTLRESDGLAFVGLSARTLLVSLRDPAKPWIAGEITGFAGRLTLSSASVLVGTGYTTLQGGIHTAVLRSPCAAFRAMLRSHPPFPAGRQGVAGLTWTMSSELTAQDGLVLTDVHLGRRQMATKMSLPYLDLVRGTATQRCELGTANDQACTGSRTTRGNLIAYTPPAVANGVLSLEAEYLFDQLDGDPNVTPEAADSCLVVTQRYEFLEEGARPLEPFGKFPAAQFRPLVRYQYFTDHGPKLTTVTTAQRLAFDARRADAPALKAPSNAILLACDVGNPLDYSCWPSIPNGSVLGLFGGHNPLPHEIYVPVLDKGQRLATSDPEESTFSIARYVDNFHSSPQPADPARMDQSLDEPGVLAFGCPGCVHIHWRWSGVLKNPPNLSVDKAFFNNNGNLFIPPGSNQDLAIAVEGAGSGFEHLARTATVKDLVNRSNSILPSALASIGTKPAFWYVATGRRNSDEFFQHGGGFGTYFVNKVSAPLNTPVAIEVEHTRSLNYEIQVNELLVKKAPAPQDKQAAGVETKQIPVSFPLITGTLAPGQDVIQLPNVSFGLGTLSLSLRISLKDPTLMVPGPTRRFEFLRTFDFNQPGVQEP
jgi:hypothetical protein